VFSNPFLLVAKVGNVVAFPLILTWTRSLPLTRPYGLRLRRIPIAASQPAIVSRREKEQPMFHFLKFVSIQAAFSDGFARTLGVFLPRPAGEGWGEGEAWPSNVDS
jgi:hypothetical protein